MTRPQDMTVAQIRELLSATAEPLLERTLERFASDPRGGVSAAVASARSRLARFHAENERLSALYEMQAVLSNGGVTVVAGVDEVGRGAIAGPLTACACVLPIDPKIPGLDDSKRLTPRRREDLYAQIVSVAVAFHVAHVTAAEIDDMGMARALRRAMGRSLAGLPVEVDHLVVDGLPVGVHVNETAVVKGDSKVASIAAASILAKVTRDRIMTESARELPYWGFDINKGYGTSEHFDAIARHGLSPIHRATFCRGGGTPTLF